MSDMGYETRYSQLIDSVFAICDGEAPEAEIERIECMLAEDPTARLVYLQCLEMHLQMDRRAAAQTDGSGFDVQGGKDCQSVLHRVAESASHPSGRANSSEPISTDARSFVHPSAFNSLASAFGGWLVPYVVATLVMGAGLLAAWSWNIRSGHEAGPIAQGALPKTPVAAQASEPIGKITKADNCTWWGHPRNTAKLGDEVTVGRKYAMQSGVLEVTYNGGAKVLLRGHCAYQVDSAKSGVLYAGAATVNVTPPPAASEKTAFVLQTPDFVFTDLYGDFEVSVQHMGGKQMTRMVNVNGKVLGRMSEEAIKGGMLVQFHAQPQKGERGYCWEIIKETGGRQAPPGRDEDQNNRAPAGG